jgi:hypothetical protein
MRQVNAPPLRRRAIPRHVTHRRKLLIISVATVTVLVMIIL